MSKTKGFRLGINPWEGVTHGVRHLLDQSNHLMDRYMGMIDDVHDLVRNANTLVVRMRERTELEIELLKKSAAANPRPAAPARSKSRRKKSE